MSSAYRIVYATYGRGIRFSREELKHILASILVLVFAFALVTSSVLFRPNLALFGTAMLTALLAIGVGFLAHELAHKFVAQKYGCWAEYRASGFWLLLTIITAFLGLVFAAPGAVYVLGYVTTRQNGKINAAGPLTNVVIGAVGLAITALAPIPVEARSIAHYVSFINLFLAIFNMMPVMPLDGAKVLRWDLKIYIGILALIIALLVPVTKGIYW